MFQAECTSAVELLKLGTDITDIIDGFDMLKQDYNEHWTVMLQQSRKNPYDQPAAVVKAHVEEVDVIPHWNLVSRQLPVLRHMDSKRNGPFVDGRVPSSDTPESSHTAKEQTRDEEGFGLKPSYFQKTRRA
jgi:hypothetical protein